MSPTGFGSQVVLITGAASGIGQATARALGAPGARLALLDRQAAPLESLAASLQAVRAEILPLTADVTQWEMVEPAVAQVHARWGRIDVLINSAGILRTGPFDKTPPEAHRVQMEVNYLGTVHCIRAVLPIMRRQRAGVIVNMASVAGLRGLPEFSGYSASKFAVMGLSQSLRDELRPDGISVVVVCPPSVDTPMVRGLADRPAIYDRFPALPAERVAQAMLAGIQAKRFLIFPDARTRWLWRLLRLWPTFADRLVRAWSRR